MITSYSRNNFQLFLVLACCTLLIRADFTPDVRWSCSSNYVSVFVRTSTPFEGIINPKGISREDCVVRGIGTNLAVFKLDFDKEHCGVQYDSEEDLYRVSVEIHSHPILIVDDDKTMNVTCRGKRNSSRDSESDTRLASYEMQILDDIVPTTRVRYAAPYSVRVLNKNPQTKFTVGKCSAAGGSNTTVELTDSRGCSSFPSLFSHFSSSSDGSSSARTARLPSMFRFPGTNQVTITCSVNECDGDCEDVDCSMDDSSVPSLLDQTTTAIETENSQISITLTVADKAEEEQHDDPEASTATTPSTSPPSPPSLLKSSGPSPSLSQPESDLQCARQADLDMMYALCVFLTVCTTLGFSLNILFCCQLIRRRGTNKKKPAVSAHSSLAPPLPSHQKRNSAAANGTSAAGDFWILDSNKSDPQQANYFDNRRNSGNSFASVKSKPRRPVLPVMEYGMPPASRSSDGGSSTYTGDIYRRPDVRHSNSTFIPSSTTMETDLDSSVSSNQASSYH